MRMRIRGLLALSVVLASLSFPAFADEILSEDKNHGVERIVSFDAELRVLTNGDLLVRETIVADVAHGEIRSGLWRHFPVEARVGGGTYPTQLYMRSATLDGKSVPFRAVRDESGHLIRVGDPALLVPYGRRTWHIEFVARGHLSRYGDDIEVYWNATGSGWKVPVNAVTVHVFLPERVLSGSPVAFRFISDRRTAESVPISPNKDGEIEIRSPRTLHPQESFVVVLAWPSSLWVPEDPSKDVTKQNTLRIPDGEGTSLRELLLETIPVNTVLRHLYSMSGVAFLFFILCIIQYVRSSMVLLPVCGTATVLPKAMCSSAAWRYALLGHVDSGVVYLVLRLFELRGRIRVEEDGTLKLTGFRDASDVLLKPLFGKRNMLSGDEKNQGMHRMVPRLEREMRRLLRTLERRGNFLSLAGTLPLFTALFFLWIGMPRSSLGLLLSTLPPAVLSAFLLRDGFFCGGIAVRHGTILRKWSARILVVFLPLLVWHVVFSKIFFPFAGNLPWGYILAVWFGFFCSFTGFFLLRGLSRQGRDFYATIGVAVKNGESIILDTSLWSVSERDGLAKLVFETLGEPVTWENFAEIARNPVALDFFSRRLFLEKGGSVPLFRTMRGSGTKTKMPES
jgi:hypothetical protein